MSILEVFQTIIGSLAVACMGAIALLFITAVGYIIKGLTTKKPQPVDDEEE
jgi:hypothetical protein